jgi:hypothetical protein
MPPVKKRFRSLLEKRRGTERFNCRFQFQKSGELFVRANNETMTVSSMHVSNPDRGAFERAYQP